MQKIYRNRKSESGRISGFYQKTSTEERSLWPCEKINKNTVEVYLIGEEKEVLDTFKKTVAKGNKKSSVENVEEQDLVYTNEPRKTGFQVITKTNRR